MDPIRGRKKRRLFLVLGKTAADTSVTQKEGPGGGGKKKG